MVLVFLEHLLVDEKFLRRLAIVILLVMVRLTLTLFWPFYDDEETKIISDHFKTSKKREESFITENEIIVGTFYSTQNEKKIKILFKFFFLNCNILFVDLKVVNLMT